MLLGHHPVAGILQVVNHVGHTHLHVQAIRCLKIFCERLGQQAWAACDLAPAVIIRQLEQHFQHGGEPARKAVLDLIGTLSISLKDDSDFAGHASRLISLLRSAARLVEDSEIRHRVEQITMRLITLCFAYAPAVPAEWVDFWPTLAVHSLLGKHHQTQSDATKVMEVCLHCCVPRLVSLLTCTAVQCD
jgi:hypothetical protein